MVEDFEEDMTASFGHQTASDGAATPLDVDRERTGRSADPLHDGQVLVVEQIGRLVSVLAPPLPPGVE